MQKIKEYELDPKPGCSMLCHMKKDGPSKEKETRGIQIHSESKAQPSEGQKELPKIISLQL